MARGGCGTILRGSGKDQTIWKLEWTYTDGSGAMSLDTTQSDEDPTIATPLTDATAGLTTVRFPKCARAWVLHASVESPTPGTAEQVAKVSDMTASTGTCTFVVLSDALALAEVTSGTRARLILLLEHP